MAAFTRDATVDLSGEWRFATDPDDVGIDREWYDSEATLPDARGVKVPHVWQSHDDLREYTGTGWYRRSFALEPEDDRRYRLRFGAVDYEATVWVNGREVGSNRGGYLPFSFDVTDQLRNGENTVAVRVHDPTDLREIPHGKQGPPWYTRVSGVWQDVSLAAVPETRVADARATPDLDADAVGLSIDVVGPVGDGLRARVTVSQDGRALGSVEGVAVEPEADEADRASEVEEADEPDEGGEADEAEAPTTTELRVDLDDPDYWTPETPALCEFEVELVDGDVVDVYADYFGMREIAVDDGEWYLNGDPLRVRGALDQAYYPDTLYWPSGADGDGYREEVETAKELGFNMLRKHIKPAHPDFLEWADRLGLLVWEEPANPDVYTDRSKREVREQFEGMVERDFNRPSVVVWSLYNEEWGIGIDQHEFPDRDDPVRLWNDAEKQSYLAAFYADARERDPTRLVCDNSGWAHVATDVNDYHEYFVVPDRVEPWRERLAEITANPSGNYASTGDGPDPADVPLVVSEFGTWGLPDVDSLAEPDGDDPHWFDHAFLDGLKRPAGVRERFAESHLSDVYDGLDALAADWQRREFDSVAELVADMRVHEDVSGYVLTEFTDVEWEFNGVLDYRRGEKSFADRFAAVNGPTMVRAVSRDRAVAADGSIRVDFDVVNDRTEPLETRLRWSVGDETGTVDVAVDPVGTTRIADAVSVDAPAADAVDGVATVDVEARLADTDAFWRASVAVVPDRPTTTPVHAADAAARDALAAAGVDSVARVDAAVVVATAPGEDELAFAADGGRLLVLPDESGRLDGAALASLGVELRELPASESWNTCASFVSQTLLDGLDRVPGWAFEGLYPYTYATSLDPTDEVHVGYTEGWLSATGGVVFTRPHGDGEVTVCGLRLTDAVDTRPVAAAALIRLVNGMPDEP